MAKPLTAEQKKQKAARDKARRAKSDGGKQAAKDKSKKGARAAKGTKPVGKAPAPSAENFKTISAGSLKSLAIDVQKAMDQSAAAGGVAGSLISDAVKKKNLNAPAFRIVHRIRRLALRDPVKARVLWDDLIDYAEKIDLEKLMGDSLFEAGAGRQEDDGDDTGDQAGGDGGNVVNLPEREPVAANG